MGEQKHLKRGLCGSWDLRAEWRFRGLLRAAEGVGERGAEGGAQKVTEGALCSRPRPGTSPDGPVLIKSFICYLLDVAPALSGRHPAGTFQQHL